MSEHLSQPYTAEDAEARRAGVRWPGDGLTAGFARPALEPLATRLERGSRVDICREMTYEMLTAFTAAGWPSLVFCGVWVKGIHIDFVVLTWKGVFLVWSIDHRWTYKQAAMVMPARIQIQRDVGDGWSGQVEAIFHSPREQTGWTRRMAVDQDTGQAVEIVIAGGRIDEVLVQWQPAGGMGIDPEWLRWLTGATEPRWERSAEGGYKLPEAPPHERL